MSHSPMVFVPGFWHGSWCWNKVVEHLAPERRTLAVDLLGQGLHARTPESAYARPFDEAAYAAEPSALAETTLDDAAALLIDQIRAFSGGERVVLVAHSFGGAVAGRAAQEIPELIAHLAYVAAVMPAGGRSGAAYLAGPEQEGELLSAALVADPFDIGVSRIDTGSPAARRRLREVLYHDVAPEVGEAAISLLNTDALVGIAVGTTTLTAPGWGSLPRTYLRCAADLVIRPALQDRFIRDADEQFPANPTRVVTLDTGHSPFLAAPAELAGALRALG